MKIDENFDKLLKKANEFEKKEFPMGIGIIMQEGITNTLIKFGNEILKDCEKEKEKLQDENILLKNEIHKLTCEFENK